MLTYTTDDGNLHLYNGVTSTWQALTAYNTRSYNYEPANATDFYAGFYLAPPADSNHAAFGTQTYGAANNSFAAHAFVVMKENGTATGGSSGDAQIRVTGASIDDNGNFNGSDEEILVAAITSAGTNTYYETTKKWVGTVTFNFEKTDAGDRTGGTTDFNYGFCKYDDFGNRDMILKDFECNGRAGTVGESAGTHNLELLHHKTTNWTYHATAFDPGASDMVICDLQTDHGSTYSSWIANQYINYKRSDLSTVISGSGSEGYMIRITTNGANAIKHLNMHVGANL
jgi:hypothetical protein